MRVVRVVLVVFSVYVYVLFLYCVHLVVMWIRAGFFCLGKSWAKQESVLLCWARAAPCCCLYAQGIYDCRHNELHGVSTDILLFLHPPSLL